jgi:hypothetical protein
VPAPRGDRAVTDLGAVRAIHSAGALIEADARLTAAVGLLRYARQGRLPVDVAIAGALRLVHVALAHLDSGATNGAA